MIEVGADRLVADPSPLAGRRWALLGHGASRTRDCRPLHLALAETAAGLPELLVGPEHGYHGVEQDMVATSDARDPWTGVPIASIYGDDVASLRPDPELFSDVEVLVLDVQDVGSRYYTYLASCVWTAEAALAAGVEVWCLDRPNPLGGAVVEGPRVRPGFESFVGAFPHPVRHGLTAAELLTMELRRAGADTAGFHVVEMRGWSRADTWTATGWPWVAPSPNMPTPETAFLYPGACLIEATEISEGRGTTRPFQLIGAPGVDGRRLAAALRAREIPGVAHLPSFFRPGYQKHSGRACAGIEQILTDADALPSFRAGIELVVALRRTASEVFAWREAPYEFVTDRPAIDLLTGSAEFRERIDDDAALEAWRRSWKADEASFEEERRDLLLYD